MVVQRHLLPDATNLEREAYENMILSPKSKMLRGGVQSMKDLGDEFEVADDDVPLFTDEQVAEYEKYLNIEENEDDKRPNDETELVGQTNRRFASVVFKMGFQGLLNTSKIVRFKYRRLAFALLFLITCITTFATMPLLNPGFRETISVEGSLSCPFESDPEGTQQKLAFIQEKVRGITQFERAKELSELSTLRVQQALMLLHLGITKSTGEELYPGFPAGCPAAVEALSNSVVNSAARNCVEESCDFKLPAGIDDPALVDLEDIEKVICRANQVACPLLPGIEALGLPDDVLEQFNTLRKLVDNGNLNSNLVIDQLLDNGKEFFLDGSSNAASRKVRNKLNFYQRRAFQLSAIYNTYLIIILLLAPALILSKPGVINRFVVGTLVPSKILLFVVATIGLIAVELSEQEEFLLWVGRLTTDSCQIDSRFTAAKTDQIVNDCSKIFTFRETVRFNRFFLEDLNNAAEAYETCFGDFWNTLAFGNAAEQNMADPFPFAFLVASSADVVEVNTSISIPQSVELLGIDPNLLDDDLENFFQGFSFENALTELSLDAPENEFINNLETVCNIPDLIDQTFVSRILISQVLKPLGLFIAQALITPSLLNLIWHIFAEFFPLAHSRGKVEFFIGTRDDAKMKHFLTIDQYFVLKETARRLDRVSNRLGLVIFSILLPVSIIAVKFSELGPASAEIYSELFE